MKLISKETLRKYTQTSGERNEIDEILAPVLLVQSIYGQQILDPNWTWKKTAFNHFSSALLLIYALIGTADFMYQTDDMLLFAEALFTVNVILQFAVKFYLFALYRSIFCKLYLTAKTTFCKLITDVFPEKGTEIFDRVRKMTIFHFMIVIIPVSSYLLVALWSYSHGFRVTLSKTTSTLMPMTTPYYEFGIFLHLNFLIMVSYSLMVIDFWYTFLTLFLCEAEECALEILTVERKEDEGDISYAIRLNDALRRFYAVHVQLMAYLNSMRVMYKWASLVPMFGALASTLVFLTTMTEEINWNILAVMIPASCEIFAYHMLGEVIKSKASDIKAALHNFDWTCMRIEDRKNYILIVGYINQEFNIRTAIGKDLSLLTLSNIYKGSYQVFAVLNTTQK